MREGDLETAGIFTGLSAGVPLFWTCVRTRPRWEKKFACFLAKKSIPFFLPTVERVSRSHRHRRVTDILLFPGYVFVEGDRTKRDFMPEQSVVRLLKPGGPDQIRILHEELWCIWLGIRSGAILTPAEKVAVGEWCRIRNGPLQGVRGRYEKKGRQGRIVLQVDLLGAGVMVEVSLDQVDPEV